MKRSLFSKLCCPFDKQELSLTVFKETNEGDIKEGLLQCNCCQRYYPIIYGLPIMTPDEYREKALEEPILQKWGLSATQAQFTLKE